VLVDPSKSWFPPCPVFSNLALFQVWFFFSICLPGGQFFFHLLESVIFFSVLLALGFLPPPPPFPSFGKNFPLGLSSTLGDVLPFFPFLAYTPLTLLKTRIVLFPFFGGFCFLIRQGCPWRPLRCLWGVAPPRRRPFGLGLFHFEVFLTPTGTGHPSSTGVLVKSLNFLADSPRRPC